ncbi:UDP-glucose 4-epimerase GalE [Shewanella sp. 1_MG-2023]|uniref:UDP-glucose 4-epimerase GalE n=1 Tax=unclassified Shewanella TaxID=196818 RepID=UPI0026E19BF3|nr:MULTISPECIES: UDP-glucose 4-epimerase GalE [unclassified Shewanella]MDO6612868.1 UDP-glucose 4-epimerase GalE [Shewanella sp. 7_MG-2023]MDO6772602.1 UDP-glucose 4-epimerase GalE [Shewanella sp. 2_MG-2023]MDO6795194.1 UDP-glucose 4-epimerase GalE [Shewanella sp. 1_MG-2023]
MNVLVTGGAGYIGSHTVLSLLENNCNVVVFDNLFNSSIESIKRVESLTGKSVTFIEGDIRNKHQLSNVFSSHNIDTVIHFAALKAVGESAQIPLEYYQNNVHGSVCLLEAMAEHKVNNFIFSSSATVYGEENEVPYVETMKLGTPSSPYGATKVMVERIMADTAASNPHFRGVSLRYFNPIGAHESGKIGESPKGIPNNLLPYVAQVMVGKREKLSIFGSDYPTKDGTCERDYLHVMDLAEGHVAAMKWLNDNQGFAGVESFNLGTGNGVSVFEIVTAFEQAVDKKIPYEVSPRRAGDLPAFWANATKANDALNWQANRSLDQMMVDTWRWQSANPNGYDEDE